MPQTVIQEEEECVDLGSTWPRKVGKEANWKKKQLRRAQPARLLKQQATNGIERTPVRTTGESTRNTPTIEELGQNSSEFHSSMSGNKKIAEAVDHALTTMVTVTPPRTDPLQRRAAGLTNEDTDDEEVGVASTSAKLTSYSSLVPVHQRSKSKVDPVDEPDSGGLGSYIAQMRARGHKRSTSAPIRARLQTTPPSMSEVLPNHIIESKQDSFEENKVGVVVGVACEMFVLYLIV